MSLPEPLDADDITRHVEADPELKRNMVQHGLIWFFMGRYYLTARGKQVMQQRYRARKDALKRGLVQPTDQEPIND